LSPERQGLKERWHGASASAVGTSLMMMTAYLGKQKRMDSHTMPSKHTTIAMGGATGHTGICLLLWMHSYRLVEFTWHVVVKKSKMTCCFT
jgi:hypothetical protein